MARVRTSRRPARRRVKPALARPPMRRTPRRQTPEKLKFRQLMMLALSIFFVLGFCASGLYSLFFLWQRGFFQERFESARHTFYESSQDLGFALENVVVFGRERTNLEDLKHNLPFEPGESLFRYDLQKVATALESLPWIDSALIERHLPSKIYVYLKERQPAALWQLDAQIYLVDAKGKIIPGQDINAYEDLMMVVGPGANLKVGEFLAILESEPDLLSRVVAGIWVSQRRWNLLIDNGIFVNLPEEGALEAYHQLARLNQEHDILKKNVRVIDMRVEDRLILELPQEAPRSSNRLEQRT